MGFNDVGPAQKGEVCELRIAAKLIEMGYVVLTPRTPERFDLVYYDGQTFTRAQCKSGRLRNGYIVFNASSRNRRRARNGEHYSYTKNDIDVFIIYCIDLNECYLVPVDGAHTELRLRIDPTKTKRSKFIRWAKDFLLSDSKK